jgi:hypothetical protein
MTELKQNATDKMMISQRDTRQRKLLRQPVLILCTPEWLRQPNESLPAFTAFQTWLRLGDDRTARATAEIVKKRICLIHRWAQHWRWAERLDFLNAHDEHVRNKAIYDAFRQEEKKWAERRARSREEAFMLSEELIKKAREMLEHPLIEKTVQKTLNVGDTEVEQEIILRPTRFAARDAGYMLKIAIDMQNLSVGLPTERPNVPKNYDDDIDFKSLTIAQLERIAAGEDPYETIIESESVS